MIKGLHHNVYRCRDSEETRSFYEDFLGLRFVSAFEIDEGRGLHSFFEMDDGSCLAFFEVPGKSFDFKRQDTLDLHIALGVGSDVFERMLDRAQPEGGTHMRAAVMHEARQPLAIETLEIAKPSAHEVLLLTAFTGLCHSDLHFMEGLYPMPTPCVLGHEASAVVEAVGSEVTY